MVLPKALYGCELWNTYSKQDINTLEKEHRFCVKHMQQFVKNDSRCFSLTCINLVTIETFIDFKKLQFLWTSVINCMEYRVWKVDTQKPIRPV